MVHSKSVKQAGGPATYSTAAAKVVKGELPIRLRKVMGQAGALCGAVDNVNAHSLAVLLFPGSALFGIVWLALFVFAIELAQPVGILVAPPFAGSVGSILVISLALGFALLTCTCESIRLSFVGIKMLTCGRLPLLTLATSLRIEYASIYSRLALPFHVRCLFGSVSSCLINWSLFTRFYLIGACRLRQGLNPSFFLLSVVPLHSLAGFARSAKIAKGPIGEVITDAKKLFGSRLLFQADAANLEAFFGHKLFALGEASACYADREKPIVMPDVAVKVVGVSRQPFLAFTALLEAGADLPWGRWWVNLLPLSARLCSYAALADVIKARWLAFLPMEIFSRSRQQLLAFAALLMGYIWGMIRHGNSLLSAIVLSGGADNTARSPLTPTHYTTFRPRPMLQEAYPCNL